MAREAVEVVTHRVVKKVRYTGALKKKMDKKPRSSPHLHPAPTAAIVRPICKTRVACKIYFEVDSGSGEEFNFGDGDMSESEGTDFEPGGRMMATVSKQSGQVETAL